MPQGQLKVKKSVGTKKAANRHGKLVQAKKGVNISFECFTRPSMHPETHDELRYGEGYEQPENNLESYPCFLECFTECASDFTALLITVVYKYD